MSLPTDLSPLAAELASLEFETFEIEDYANTTEMLLLRPSSTSCSGTTSCTACCGGDW